MPRIDATHGVDSGAAQPADAILEARGLAKKFGAFTAVDGVDLSIQSRHIHSIIGPNGAGKTTLFNLLAGALRPSAGSIHFDGDDVTRRSDAQRVQAGMARSFQVTTLFGRLTVFENLRLAAQSVQPRRAFRFWEHAEHYDPPRETAAGLMRRLGLQRYSDTQAGTLAHGQQRLLEVGMCLAARPKLLLLDEPTSGMGVNDLPLMRDLIRDVARDHTVVLIEHNMSIVLDISDRITVMARGSILAQGTAAEIREHEGVRRAYLGTAHTNAEGRT